MKNAKTMTAKEFEQEVTGEDSKVLALLDVEGVKNSVTELANDIMLTLENIGDDDVSIVRVELSPEDTQLRFDYYPIFVSIKSGFILDKSPQTISEQAVIELYERLKSA